MKYLSKGNQVLTKTTWTEASGLLFTNILCINSSGVLFSINHSQIYWSMIQSLSSTHPHHTFTSPHGLHSSHLKCYSYNAICTHTSILLIFKCGNYAKMWTIQFHLWLLRPYLPTTHEFCGTSESNVCLLSLLCY